MDIASAPLVFDVGEALPDNVVIKRHTDGLGTFEV
jgi:hypothetical protein